MYHPLSHQELTHRLQGIHDVYVKEAESDLRGLLRSKFRLPLEVSIWGGIVKILLPVFESGLSSYAETKEPEVIEEIRQYLEDLLGDLRNITVWAIPVLEMNNVEHAEQNIRDQLKMVDEELEAIRDYMEDEIFVPWYHGRILINKGSFMIAGDGTDPDNDQQTLEQVFEYLKETPWSAYIEKEKEND